MQYKVRTTDCNCNHNWPDRYPGPNPWRPGPPPYPWRPGPPPGRRPMPPGPPHGQPGCYGCHPGPRPWYR